MEAPGRNDTGVVVDDDHDGLTEMEWLEREQEKEMIQLAMERSLNEFHHVQQPIMDSGYYQRQQQQQPMAERDFSFSQDRQAMHQQNEAMEPDIFHDRRHSYNNNNNNNNNNPSRNDRFSSGTSGMHHHPSFERDPHQPHPSRDDIRFSPRQDAIRRRDPSANHNQWPEFPANQYTSRDRFDTARHNMGGSMRNLGSGRDVHNNNRSSYQRGGSFRAIEEVTETVIDSPHHHHPSYDRVNEHRGASNYNSHLHHDEWTSPAEPFNDYRESSQAPYHRQTPPSDYGRRTPPRDGRRTPPRYREPAQQLPPVVRERNHMTPNMMTPRDQARDAVLQTARQHLSAEEAELVDQALRLGRTAPSDIVQPNSEGPVGEYNTSSSSATKANHEGSATSPTALQSGGENSYIHGSSLSAEAIPDEEQSTPPSGDCNVEVATDTTLITDSDHSRNSNSQEGAHAPKPAVTDETKNNVESTEAEGASGAASGPSGTEERQVCSERTDVDQPSIESTGIIEQLAVAKIAGDLSPSELESSAGVELNALSAYLDTSSAENKSDDGSTILPVAIPLATPTAAPRYAPRESQATPLDPPDEDQLPAIYNRDTSHTGAMDEHSGAPYSERRALDVRVAPDAQDYAFDQQHGQQEWRDNTGNGPNAGEFSANYDRRFVEPAQQHPRDFRRGSHVPQPDFDRWSDNYGLDRGAVQNAPEASQQPRMTRGDNRQSFVSDRHQYSSVEQAGPNHQVDGGGAGQPWDTAHRQPDRAGVPAQVTDPRDSRWVSSNNSVSSLGESTQFSLFSGHLPYQKQGSFRNSENYDRALSEHNNWRQSNPTPMTHSILETSGHRQEPNHLNSDHANSSWQHQQLSSPQLSYTGVSGAERGQRIGRDCEERLVSFNRAGNSGSRTPPILYIQERNHGRIIDQPSDYIKGRDRLANRESFNGQAMECDQERDRVAGHDSFVGGRAHENVESYSQELRASDHDRFDAELKRALFESIQMQQTPLAEPGCEQDPPYTQSFPPEALLSQEQLDHINRALAAPVEDEQTPRSSSYGESERSRLSSAGTTILENERLATRSASFPLNQADELPHFPAVTDADFECALQEAKDEEERQSLLLARQLQEEEERRLPGLPQNRASLSPGSQAIDSAIGQDSTFSSVTPRRTSQVGAVRSSSPARAQHPLESSFVSLPPQRASARNLASTHRDRQPMEDSFASLPRPQLEGSSQANERSRQSLGNSSNSAREEQPPEHTRRPIRDASSSELVTSGTPEQGQPSISKDTVSEKKSRRDSKVLGSVAKLGKKGVGSLLQTMKRSSVRRVSLTAGGSADQDEGATETASSDLTTETLLQIDRAVVKGVICKLNGAVKMGNEATLFHADGGPESDGFDVAVKVYKRALGLGGSNQEERTGKDLSQFRNISSSEQLELWTIKEYRNLKRARKAGVPAPAALMARQNILFMHFVGENGVPAPQLGQLELRRGHKRWKALYKQIIEAIWRLYNDAVLVHGNLNETNILVVPKRVFELRMTNVVVNDSKGHEGNADQAVLIDFGQTVDSGHPDAKDLLLHDLQRIRQFFVKQGIRTPPVEDTMKHVMDGKNISSAESKTKSK